MQNITKRDPRLFPWVFFPHTRKKAAIPHDPESSPLCVHCQRWSQHQYLLNLTMKADWGSSEFEFILMSLTNSTNCVFPAQSILIHWTKGFNCSGVEGKDVVQLLKEAIHRRGVSPKHSQKSSHAFSLGPVEPSTYLHCFGVKCKDIWSVASFLSRYARILSNTVYNNTLVQVSLIWLMIGHSSNNYSSYTSYEWSKDGYLRVM